MPRGCNRGEHRPRPVALILNPPPANRPHPNPSPNPSRNPNIRPIAPDQSHLQLAGAFVSPRGVKVDALGNVVQGAALQGTHSLHQLQGARDCLGRQLVVKKHQQHKKPHKHLILGQLGRDLGLVVALLFVGARWRRERLGRLREQRKHLEKRTAQHRGRRDV